MSHQVIWTRETLEFFLAEGNFTELEQNIMRSRVRGLTRVQQSIAYNVSLATVDRAIKKLKVTYDYIQMQNPDKLPPRKFSIKELYMDAHL